MARREKKSVHKVVMTEGKRNIIQQLLQEYDIETAEDIQDALKDLLGGTIKEMMVPPRWILILDTANLSVQIMMTTETAISQNESTAVMAPWRLTLPKTVSQHLSHRS